LNPGPKADNGKASRLVEALSECSNEQIFETKLIMTIIDYKWDTYTRDYFLKQLLIFLGFVTAFVMMIVLRASSMESAFMYYMLKSIAAVCGLATQAFLYKHEL
jgi:hypothetical protein